ncbi:MAG: thioredoxin family protein [Anaerolineae bacterium]|nr:thioredoxin family protein [Anaerolineae bacterium]
MTTLNRVTEYDFEELVLHSKLPVLVDFGAEWCSPCKRQEPLLEKLAVLWSQQLKIVQVDMDQSAGLGTQLQIMGLPTLILFVDGSECIRLTGLQTENQIIKKMSPYLSQN